MVGLSVDLLAETVDGAGPNKEQYPKTDISEVDVCMPTSNRPVIHSRRQWTGLLWFSEKLLNLYVGDIVDKESVCFYYSGL